MDNYAEKTVVITGGSAGVGRALTREFANRNYNVAILARGEDRLQEAASEVKNAGANCIAIQADVANHEQLQAAAERIETELGPIDIWINNAMASVFSPIEKVTPDEFKRVTDVTYLGAVYGTQVALKKMRVRNRGLIVQIGSTLAFRAIPLQSAYCAAKHALRAFTESLISELLHDHSGIRVTMVHLPAINTPQFDWARNKMTHKLQPIPPIYQPEVAARAILWAVENVPREMKVGFSTVFTVAINKVLPGLIDHYLARFAYSGQQDKEPKDPASPDNLFYPVPGNFSAHGRFTDRSKHTSLFTWLNMHKPVAFLALGALIGGTQYLTRRR